MYTYLKYQPPAVQFLAFLALASGFFLLDVAFSTIFFSDLGPVLVDKNAVVPQELINKVKWLQLSGSVIHFVLPALFFGHYSSPKALSYVGIQKFITPAIFIAAIFLMFCIQPFAGWLGEINAHIKFGSMQKSFEETEAMNDRLFKIFLQMRNVGDLLINLLVLALLPAIAEELFFRGALQKTILRMSGKPWLSILISSVIFALLHNSVFKLLPILTLGILLGTVYYVTRNLWYNITIHFLNNAFAVLSVYYAGKSEVLKKLSGDDMTVPFYAALISLIIAVGIIYFMKKESDKALPEIITNEDNDYLAS